MILDKSIYVFAKILCSSNMDATKIHSKNAAR